MTTEKLVKKITNKRSMSKGCYICTEKRVDSAGHSFCPHFRCPFEEKDLEWWKDVGGKVLIEVK